MPVRTRNAFRMQLLPLVAGFIVLGGIVLSRAWQIEEQRADNVAVRQAFQVERTLGTILSLLQDAENRPARLRDHRQRRLSRAPTTRLFAAFPHGWPTSTARCLPIGAAQPV